MDIKDYVEKVVLANTIKTVEYEILGYPDWVKCDNIKQLAEQINLDGAVRLKPLDWGCCAFDLHGGYVKDVINFHGDPVMVTRNDDGIPAVAWYRCKTLESYKQRVNFQIGTAYGTLSVSDGHCIRRLQLIHLYRAICEKFYDYSFPNIMREPGSDDISLYVRDFDKMNKKQRLKLPGYREQPERFKDFALIDWIHVISYPEIEIELLQQR